VVHLFYEKWQNLWAIAKIFDLSAANETLVSLIFGVTQTIEKVGTWASIQK